MTICGTDEFMAPEVTFGMGTYTEACIILFIFVCK